jgi:Domain of unknown function (DUF4232)
MRVTRHRSVFLLALMVVGCASPAATSTAPPPAGSSTAPSPATSSSPTPLAVPPLSQTCAASDLAGRYWTTGAGGTQGGGLTVWLDGTRACWLDGYPTLAITNGDGKTLAISYVAYPGAAPDAAILGPALLLPGLGAPPDPLTGPPPFGQSAGVEVVWSNWCGTPIHGPGTVSVILPNGGGTLQVEAALESPRCDATGQPSTIDFSHFEMPTAAPTGTVLPVPTPVPTAARACGAGDLGIRLTPWSTLLGAVGGGHGVLLTVWNQSASACHIAGVPQISFVDGAGQSFTPPVTPDGSPQAVVTLLSDLGEPPLGAGPLRGGTATSSVLWQPACGTRISGSTVTAVVHLGDGTLAVRIPAPEPICPTPSDATETLIVSPWAADWQS